MVRLLMWVLVGIVLYTVVAMALRNRGYLPDALKVSGPILTIHTKRGRDLLDWLAGPKRFWRAWGNLGVGVTVVMMVLSGITVLLSVRAILRQPEEAAIQNPQNALVIPGVNEFLPLSAGVEIVFALLVGLLVHEGGHGLLCRVEDIDIDSMGVVLFSFIPIGAFVQPKAQSQHEADRGAQVRMFAAGITNNFAVTAIALLLLAGPIGASVSVAPGTPVGDTLPGSGASDAELEHGDRITAINGQPVANATQMEAVVENTSDSTLSVGLGDGSTVTVKRRLLVVGAVRGVADNILGRDPLTQIKTVNGSQVRTREQFTAAVTDRPVVQVMTTRGKATFPVGAFVSNVTAGGPLATSGAPTDGTPMIITHVDDQRVVNTTALASVLDGHSVGDTVTVRAYVRNGETGYTPRTYTVSLTDGDQKAMLGAQTQPGHSGFVMDDFGVDPYPAGEFLAMLTGQGAMEGLSFVSGLFVYLLQLLVLPFIGLVGTTSYNFSGFTGEVTNFFVVQGPLGFMGGGLLFIANLLFWTGWLNFNLALFNCIPTYPLDGGHILRMSTESVASRLPISRARRVVTVVTVGITIVMVVALLALIFGPALLT